MNWSTILAPLLANVLYQSESDEPFIPVESPLPAPAAALAAWNVHFGEVLDYDAFAAPLRSGSFSEAFKAIESVLRSQLTAIEVRKTPLAAECTFAIYVLGVTAQGKVAGIRTTVVET